MAAMAAAAAGHGDAPLGGGAYPTVLRDILGEVPSPNMGRNQVYPNIPPGGVAPQFNAAAAAAAGDQVRSKGWLRLTGVRLGLLSSVTAAAGCVEAGAAC